jgi:dihydrofolate synthase/folylpolyglutamate synthase
MNYEEALAYWYGHVNFEQATPGPSELKLERMRALLRLLGNPHRRLRIVHVAGSKGKGSISAMLAAIFRQAGHRTGLFTSPHLCRVEERFQVDGQPISQAELATALTDVRATVEGGRRALGGLPTFFEVATAVGFLHFVRRRVGAVVLEVGLGGRLDSTNVCLPVVSVITSISFDHTNVLGHQLTSIAREKAGIVKRGRPVVSGATVGEARAVIEEVCRARGAPLRQFGADFQYRYEPGQVSDSGVVRPRVEVQSRARRWPMLEVNLLGEHQAANATVAIATVEELRRAGWHLPDEAVARGLREVDWPARLEVCGRRPLLVLDCAHNAASAVALVDTLRTSFPPARRVLVFAASGDKDVPGMFDVLAPHFSHAILTRYTSSSRSVAPEHLAELWPGSATVCATPAEALAAARQEVGADDLICIAGSVFLAGELRPLLVGERSQ